MAAIVSTNGYTPDTHRSRPVLTSLDLRAKTIWIRDSLEPSVARYGPPSLAADTVLELNAFFYKLLSLSSDHEHHKPTTANSRPPSITLNALQVSRIHRAILLIAGRGTRWPGRLIKVCDELIEVWTTRFGNLNMIRPLLYEKGGKLETMKEERNMGRHELMIKWMSDPNSLVSPLRALESGHLEFKPGQWWIHPLFAFHAGIIDSPDPHGGISADNDGAYAILLTAYDEVASETAESFIYRCRPDDQGRFRLLGGILPPKTHLRILRSHTLHSLWSPPAGVRYDGLYRITKWSLRTINEERVYEVTFQRELDQISMREARLHPNSEEVDDYIEYKRLREDRRDSKHFDRHSGMISGESEDQTTAGEATENQEDDLSVLTVRPRRQSSTWDNSSPSPFSVTKEEMDPLHLTGGLSPSRSRPRHSLDPVAVSLPVDDASRDMFDGTTSEPRGSICSIRNTNQASVLSRRPSVQASILSNASLERVRNCANMTEAEIRHDQISWIRRDSAHYSRHTSDFPAAPKKLPIGLGYASGNSIRTNSIISYAPDHKTLHDLASHVHELRDVTLRKDSVGSTFRNDLKCMQKIVAYWQVDSAETNGYVDHCLKSLETDIEAMEEHGKFDWTGFAKEGREASPLEELDGLEKYLKRYEERRGMEEGGGEIVESVGDGVKYGGKGSGKATEVEVEVLEGPWTLGGKVHLK